MERDSLGWQPPIWLWLALIFALGSCQSPPRRYTGKQPELFGLLGEDSITVLHTLKGNPRVSVDSVIRYGGFDEYHLSAPLLGSQPIGDLTIYFFSGRDRRMEWTLTSSDSVCTRADEAISDTLRTLLGDPNRQLGDKMYTWRIDGVDLDIGHWYPSTLLVELQHTDDSVEEVIHRAEMQRSDSLAGRPPFEP